MKKLVVLTALLAFAGSSAFAGKCYKKMVKKSEQVEYSANPELLTLKGSSVNADVRVSFPGKYFKKKAVLKVTPVLVFADGEIAGTPKYLQGEKVYDNYTIISYRNGGTYTQSVSFPYTDQARLSTLELRVEARCAKGKYASFAPIAAVAVAQGISTVQNDLDFVDAMELMKDNYKSVTTQTRKADIMYVINQWNVRKGELTSEQMKAFEDFIKENIDKDNVTLSNVYAKGYASPDGPEQFNDQLSKKRSESGKDAVKKSLEGVDVGYDASYYGEDWEGFKELVEASDIKDKELILNVLQMYSSSAERDQEIRNMSSVFEALAQDVLPKLRRTQMVIDADVKGMTDEEIAAVAKKNFNTLDLEEMLHAATLTDDWQTRATMYAAAAKKYDDARAYNNLGVALSHLGQSDKAREAFAQAAKLGAAPEINNNLVLAALVEGDVAEANKYVNSLSGSSAARTRALVSVAEGNYTGAAGSLSGYNLAVAEVLNGNLAQAKNALKGIDSADADYLRAVIASKEGKSSEAAASLKAAFAKDKSLVEKAKNDVNFADLFGSDEFIAL